LQASRIGFNDIYSRLGISIPEKGESYYSKMIPSVIEELVNKGIEVITEE
jgi:hypothetical protein